jgi:hypothetical protein
MLRSTLNNFKLKSCKRLADEIRIAAAELEDEAEMPEILEYRKLLTKLKGKPGIEKLKILIDNPRVRRPIRYWLDRIDKGEGAGPMDFNDMITSLKKIIKMDLPSAKYLKMLLDFGLSEGYIALNRLLEKGKAKITLMKEE